MALKMVTGGAAGPSAVLLTIDLRVLQDVLRWKIVDQGMEVTSSSYARDGYHVRAKGGEYKACNA